MSIRHLDYEAVLEINKGLIERFGGKFSVIMEGNLRYCIETVLDIGNDHKNVLDRSIDKAAFYIHCISLAHGLLDCNKRTGYQCGDIFLRANGFRLKVIETDEVVDMLRQVSTKKVTVKFVEDWVRRHIKPVSP